MSRRVDLAIGIAIVLGGLLWIYLATQIHHTIEVDAIGEAGVPIALGVLFVLGGLFVSVRAALALRNPVAAHAGAHGEAEHPQSDVRPLVIWAAALAWSLTVERVGFLIATPLLTVAVLWLLEYRSPMRVAMLSIGLSVGLFVLLDVILRVNLPSGPLAPILDPIHI